MSTMSMASTKDLEAVIKDHLTENGQLSDSPKFNPDVLLQLKMIQSWYQQDTEGCKPQYTDKLTNLFLELINKKY